VARRLELAVGETPPAKIGWPVGSDAMEVRVTGALAKLGLVVGRPPKRMVWSITGEAVPDCVTRRA
jgi:hypothetical protein